MSELKAYNSERIYWAVEQSEQEVGDIEDLHLDDTLFYLKSEADEVISTVQSERDEYRYNLSCARNEIHNMQLSMREDIKKITEKDGEIVKLKSDVRRLKRALYKSLANWAHEAKFDYDDEFSRWDDMEQKCLIKVEELK